MGSCSGGVCGWSSCSSTSAACGGGCSGTCTGTCSGCSGGCSGNCSGGCSGGCKGCSGTCSGSCNAQCDGSTQDTNIALIANLSPIILASDFINLKTCLDHELARRSETATTATFTQGSIIDDTQINNLITSINNIENEIADISNVVAGNTALITLRDALKDKIIQAYNKIV